MEGDIRFTKIKYDGSKVQLLYERERKEGDPDEFSLHSGDNPAPEFDQALQALAVDVASICELGAEAAQKLKVRGVTLTYAHDILGACVTALKSLVTANSPLVLNTPHLPSMAYSGNGDDPNPVLPDGMVVRLDALTAQAKRYLDGDRAQGSLFSEEGDTAKPEVLLELAGGLATIEFVRPPAESPLPL
jgi:hypothetical protein